MKNQKTWVAVILLGTVAVNTGAYLVMRSRRAAQAPAPSTPLVARVDPAAPGNTRPAVAAPSDDAKAGLARARRASGLAALEDRDYTRAVTEFTEALSLRNDPNGDVVELLRIATDLRAREQARVTKAPEPRESSTSKSVPRTRAARLAAARAQAREQQQQAQASEAGVERKGLLLVTSTPPGLVVLVDGKELDMTPARLSVTAGSHRVVLAQGDRHLYSETLEVAEDSVRSLNRDLTAELTPPASRSAPVAVPVVATSSAPPVAAAPVGGLAPGARSPDSTPPPEPSVAKAAVAQVAQRGDLEVTSPGLYGEVWINNRPYGFPPISAQALPAGPARVEVRVNGEVKRRMTVDVEPGRSTRVRVR
ncbi:PEGA domain-containing protein [Corallococcus terminator]|uniref:PEGA domain-containing protein n=1 Tax=Corallococcus terminator TaxID=2316733 RepID=A0A3A8JBE0_9BACT|nr:PEGA domain-containing protein [Corallococcus terminator]RKG89140.1 PEGA domain-containing protein [Corallococcus terminator]